MSDIELKTSGKELETGYKIDTKKLLSELSKDISVDFWITNETAKQLTELKSLTDLEWLKNDIAKSEISNEQKEVLNKLWDNKLEKLFFTIKWAIDVINKASQNKLDILKTEIDIFKPSASWIEARLPKNIVTKINNPQNIWDNIIWAAIWTINSLEKTTEALYNIWKWAIQLPYHIYLIIKWDAKIDLKKV